MSDRLALANVIEEAGIDHGKAEQLAAAIFDRIHDNLATKADIAPLATKVEVVAADVRGVVRAELQAVRTEVQSMRTDAKGDIALIEHRLLTRLGGLIVVMSGIILAALRYWPPGHSG